MWQFHVVIPALLHISVEALTQSGIYVGNKFQSKTVRLQQIKNKVSQKLIGAEVLGAGF